VLIEVRMWSEFFERWLEHAGAAGVREALERNLPLLRTRLAQDWTVWEERLAAEGEGNRAEKRELERQRLAAVRRRTK
jgi:hypothetical protein